MGKFVDEETTAAKSAALEPWKELLDKVLKPRGLEAGILMCFLGIVVETPDQAKVLLDVVSGTKEHTVSESYRSKADAYGSDQLMMMAGTLAECIERACEGDESLPANAILLAQAVTGLTYAVLAQAAATREQTDSIELLRQELVEVIKERS